jgi:hypothetical protein
MMQSGVPASGEVVRYTSKSQESRALERGQSFIEFMQGKKSMPVNGG